MNNACNVGFVESPLDPGDVCGAQDSEPAHLAAFPIDYLWDGINTHAINDATINDAYARKLYAQTFLNDERIHQALLYEDGLFCGTKIMIPPDPGQQVVDTRAKADTGGWGEC